MIQKYLNSSNPLASKIALSIHDDEPVMLPLTPEIQKKWNQKSLPNRKNAKRNLCAELN